LTEARVRAGREAWAVFGGLAVLYWLGRAPSFGPGDSAQHALAAVLWGVPRPPGYPLYTALAHLFALAGGVSWVGGFSALCQAGAAALVYLLARRQGCGVPAALSATLLLALAPLYWFYAEVPEVRGLNDLLAAGAAAAAVLQAPAWLLALLLGLGLSHHPTFLFIVPSVLLLARAPRRAELPAAAAAALAGLAAPYLLLWLRLSFGAPPAYNPDAAAGLSGVLALFLRRGTGGLLSAAGGAHPGLSAAGLVRQLSWYARSAYDSLTAGLVLAALGAWALRGRRRELAAWLLWALLPALVYAGFAAAQIRAEDAKYFYAVAARFHLLPLLGLAVLAAHGAQLLASRIRERFVWGLVAAAVAAGALRPASLRRHQPTRDYALDILAATRPGDAVVLDSDDAVFALLYEDLAERRGDGRVWLVPAMFGYAPYLEQLARAHPGLKAPREGGRVSLDWRRWLADNPGRAFWAEGSLRPALERDLPGSYPDGPLIRMALKESGTPAGGAERFLDSSLGRLARWRLFEFTQEVQLERDGAALAHWHLQRNGADPRLSGALAERLEALW
jgi:hypothetical protein